MNHTKWYIADMYWPKADNGAYISHEAISLLNTGNEDCEVKITMYFMDAEPKQCVPFICPARRTKHMRIDKIRYLDGSEVQRGIGYAALIECSVPAIVQYTRVDTTQSELGVATTMAYPVNN